MPNTMKTIEIAPSRKNTHIRGSMIWGNLSDGTRTYILDLPKGTKIDPAERNTVKDAFCTAIALRSKPRQTEELLSRVLGVECHITIITHPAGTPNPGPLNYR